MNLISQIYPNYCTEDHCIVSGDDDDHCIVSGDVSGDDDDHGTVSGDDDDHAVRKMGRESEVVCLRDSHFKRTIELFLAALYMPSPY